MIISRFSPFLSQRWVPIGGFGTHFLPTDRCHWSSKDGLTDRSLDKIRLPSMAWQWESDWQLELNLDGQPLEKDVSNQENFCMGYVFHNSHSYLCENAPIEARNCNNHTLKEQENIVIHYNLFDL